MGPRVEPGWSALVLPDGTLKLARSLAPEHLSPPSAGQEDEVLTPAASTSSASDSSK